MSNSFHSGLSEEMSTHTLSKQMQRAPSVASWVHTWHQHLAVALVPWIWFKLWSGKMCQNQRPKTNSASKQPHWLGDLRDTPLCRVKYCLPASVRGKTSLLWRNEEQRPLGRAAEVQEWQGAAVITHLLWDLCVTYKSMEQMKGKRGELFFNPTLEQQH